MTTTDGIDGLLDLGEVRQITSDVDSGWELHQGGVALVAEHGIETGQRFGNGFDDFLLWTRDRDRAASRCFPLGILSADFRPIFHYGPLRDYVDESGQFEDLVQNLCHHHAGLAGHSPGPFPGIDYVVDLDALDSWEWQRSPPIAPDRRICVTSTVSGDIITR